MSIASISYADKVKVKVHGGTWEYGYGWNNAYSNYKHDHKNHGAKVVNPNNGIKNFRNAGPGVWTKASIGTLWDPATFYYILQVFTHINDVICYRICIWYS